MPDWVWPLVALVATLACAFALARASIERSRAQWFQEDLKRAGRQQEQAVTFVREERDHLLVVVKDLQDRLTAPDWESYRVHRAREEAPVPQVGDLAPPPPPRTVRVQVLGGGEEEWDADLMESVRVPEGDWGRQEATSGTVTDHHPER